MDILLHTSSKVWHTWLLLFQSIDQFIQTQLFSSLDPGDLKEAQLNLFGRLRTASTALQAFPFFFLRFNEPLQSLY